MSEHATRLQRQEAGLKMYLESVQRLQAEETKLLVAIARLSKEKSALLSRAGCVGVAGEGGGGAGDAAGSNGDGGGGGGDGDYDDGRGEKNEGGEGELGEGKMQALLREKEQRAADVEREKDRLQARCRELQVTRTSGERRGRVVRATDRCGWHDGHFVYCFTHWNASVQVTS